jgi:cell division protein ZapE
VVVENIPLIKATQFNEAKRFILLIDTFYDYAVKLIASAAAEPDRFYRAGDGFEAFEFRRTASRLAEMRTAGYLALPHGRRESPTKQEVGPVES